MHNHNVHVGQDAVVVRCVTGREHHRSHADAGIGNSRGVREGKTAGHDVGPQNRAAIAQGRRCQTLAKVNGTGCGQGERGGGWVDRQHLLGGVWSVEGVPGVLKGDYRHAGADN